MTAVLVPCMTCMPRMLSSLTRVQGARPAVASLSSKAGNLQARFLSIASDHRKRAELPIQICGLSTSNFATAGKRDLCSGPKAGLAAPDVARKPGAWIDSGLSIEGRRVVRTASIRGARAFATLRSARRENQQAGVQVGFCTCIDGGKSKLRHGTSSRVWRNWRHSQLQQQQQQQQRRMYSSKDGFGGGQHFPHSDQVQG